MNENIYEGYGETFSVKENIFEEIDCSEIEEGMLLINRNQLKHKYVEPLLVMWAGASRDGKIVVRDCNGHDHFVDPEKEDYMQVLATVSAFRVLYGKSKESELKVTDRWYTDLDSFINEFKHEGFCKLIYTTHKYIPIKKS